MYNLELPSQNKPNADESTTLEGFRDNKQLATWPTISEHITNQKSNPWGFQHNDYSISISVT